MKTKTNQSFLKGAFCAIFIASFVVPLITLSASQKEDLTTAPSSVTALSPEAATERALEAQKRQNIRDSGTISPATGAAVIAPVRKIARPTLPNGVAPVSVTATAGTMGPTLYATLGAAFAAINSGTHQGAITIDIAGNTSEGATPATLNSSGSGSASYSSVLVRPSTDGVSVSGSPGQGFGVIQLNGVDNVTIDGDNPNTGGVNRNLTVSNTAAATTTFGSAIRIATSATAPFDSNNNNTIKNLIVSGNVTGGNLSSITATTTSANNSFGIVVGPNGGASVTALASVTTAVAAGVTVNGLVVDNNVINQCGRGVSFLGTSAASSTGVTISNNVIGDQGAATPATPPFTSPSTTVYTKGILVSGTASIAITNNTIRNVFSFVGITTTSIELTASVTNSTITGNTISNIANNGTTSIVKALLVTASTAGYSIAGNSITNVQALAGSSGTDGIEITAAPTNGLIERNKVQTVYNRSTGTFGPYGINLTAGTGIVVRNNFVSDLNMDMTGGIAFSTTFGVHGIRIAGGTNHKIYHNSVQMFGTLLGTPASSILTAGLTITSTAITGVDARNNILSNLLNGGTTSVAHVSLFLPTNSATAMGLTLNNNDYFSGTDSARQGIAQAGTTAGTGFYLASNFDAAMTTPATNLRALTTTLGTATNDNATKVVDPQYLSTTDLHIAVASPMVDMGVDVGVPKDIDGQLRVPPPDIGADEPSGITPAANDIASTGITTPAIGSSFSTGTVVSPQAMFTNVGSATQSSVMVQFAITGPGGYNYSNTQSIASIAPDQTVTVTFAAAPAFTTPGTYNMTASVTTADSNPANDTQMGTFMVLAPLSGTYNVPGAEFTSLTNNGGIFAALNSAGASSNIVINIAADLSGETGTNALNELPGGFTVTIKPTGTPPRMITGSSTLAIIRINGADGVTINGSTAALRPGVVGTNVVGGDPSLRELTITNTNTAATAGAVIAVTEGTNGAQNFTIKNVNIVGQDPTQTLIGIHIGGNSVGSAPVTANNNNARVENCSFQKAFVGIFDDGISAASAATGHVLTMNDLSATGANRLRRVGLFLFNQNGIQVTENSIGGISTDESADGIGIVAGVQNVTTTTATSGGIFNAFISRNKINGVTATSTVGFSAVGIAIAGDAAGPNTIVNNMISGVIAPSTSPDLVAGIFVAGVTGSNTKVYDNSVAMTGDRGSVASQIGSYGIAISGTNPIVDLKGNIFYNTQTSGGGANAKSYALGTQTTTASMSNLSSNFNDLFTSGANASFTRTGSLDTSGTDQANLAAWQAVSGKDANSIPGDPLFASATNLHLTCGSPAIGAGMTITGITIDIDGDTRLAPPAIGADEPVPPAPISAVSRKMHGAGGPVFDINLPFAGPIGIESRSGGAMNAYQVVFTFGVPVSATSAAVTGGTGVVAMASGNGTNTITVDLTGVTSAQYLTVTLNCVTDGVNVGNISATMGVLVGDVNASGLVSSTDVTITKSQSGNAAIAANFRADVNASGLVSSTDVTITKSQSGSGLPMNRSDR